MTHHQAGRLADAEALYRKVLETTPNHPDALHLLGVIAHQVGRNEVAAELIAKAVSFGPSAAMYCNLGLVLDALGKKQGAADCFRQAIALQPDHVEAFVNLGATLKDQGQFADAVDSYRRALALQPQFAEVHYNLGVALQAQGKLDEALGAYRQALALNPNILAAYLNLGGILKERGQRLEAIEAYRNALARKSDYGEAHYNLAIALQGQDRLDEEIAHYRQALAVRPDHPEAHSNLGNALKAQGRLDEAAAHYREAIRLKPDYAEAYYNQGILLRAQDKPVAAIDSYRQAIALKPDYADAHSNLAEILMAQGRLEEAIRHYRQVIAIRPEDSDAYCNLGVVLRLQGEEAEAARCCQQAIALKPDFAKAHALLGNIHVDQGRFDLAKLEIAKALEFEPDNCVALASLANLRKMTPADDDWRQKALALLPRDDGAMLSRDQVILAFALGKYYDDTKQYDLAFAAYRRANEVRRQETGVFDRAKHTRLVDALIDTYSADFLHQTREGASPSERPVLIVGMPRSGTSLTEQIIASHPQAFGAGELTYWGAVSRANPSLELSGYFDAAFLRRTAEAYGNELMRHSATARRIVDKMPGNFWRLGLITTVFPQARIIHTQRNPVDTCLSIYFQNFTATHPYATDLDDLAFYYREYVRIMNHWRSVLPKERFLEVPYEALTADQEGWSRRIIAFLGLDWDERCLNFHETDRTVGTASNWQVRQKIYQTSKERWRNYENHVGPLLGLLELEAGPVTG